LRPMSPSEVFDYPPEMVDLAKQNILGRMSPEALTLRGRALGKPAPKIAGLISGDAPVQDTVPPSDVSSESLPTQETPAEVPDGDPSEPADEQPASPSPAETPVIPEEEEEKK